jgi:hypothetical protein
MNPQLRQHAMILKRYTPSAPALGRPGSIAGCAGCEHPARRIGAASHRQPAGVAGSLRSPGGSVAAPFRAGPCGRGGCRWPAGPLPAVTGAPPSAGGRACKSGPAVPLAPGILSPSKDHSQGARLRRGAARWRKRHPLSSDLPRRISAPIEGDGGVSRSFDAYVSSSSGWHAQLHDLPVQARRPSMTAQPAMPSATTPSSHHAPSSVFAASPANTAIAR